MRSIYTHLAALLVRTIVRFCTWRGRYVDYVHAGRTYMRRYVITGFMTGDPPALGWRARLPNLYLHHMQAPDADPSLHDHPWPWALSWILLGGYEEQRLIVPPERVRFDISDLPLRKRRAFMRRAGERWLRFFKRWGQFEPSDIRSRWFKAPALNVLHGDTFHRIAELERACATGCSPERGRVLGCISPSGVFTLFLAGPRARNKGWGYIVENRGYVPQQTRHAELDAREVRR